MGGNYCEKRGGDEGDGGWVLENWRAAVGAEVRSHAEAGDTNARSEQKEWRELVRHSTRGTETSVGEQSSPKLRFGSFANRIGPT